MAEEEKSETEEWLDILRAMRTEDLTVDYLREISHPRELNLVGIVHQNVGGPNARTLERFRDDIIAALEARLAVERVTAQLEEAQIQEVERVALVNWEQLGMETMGELADLDTDEDIRDEGGINYLRQIIRSFDLRRVNDNVGEGFRRWDPSQGGWIPNIHRPGVVTLMDVKYDIEAELFNRMPDEHEGTPYYYNSDGNLTNRTPGTDSEDSDVDGQAEPQREQETDEEESAAPEPQSQKDEEHAKLIATVQWENLYASRGVDGVMRHSDSLLTRRKYSELAEGHERDLVHELRDYEASGGDLDAIRRHIDDAASARVWDMFLTNYKRFLRTGGAS